MAAQETLNQRSPSVLLVGTVLIEDGDAGVKIADQRQASQSEQAVLPAFVDGQLFQGLNDGPLRGQVLVNGRRRPLFNGT